MLIFTYGTLKMGHKNHSFLLKFVSYARCSFVSKAVTVRKYPLTVDEKLYKVPCMLDCRTHPEAKHIVGEVYEFEDDYIHFLDNFESYSPKKSNNWYTRMKIDVRLEKDCSEVTCSAYLISENKEVLERLEKNDFFFNDYTKAVVARYSYDWAKDPECRLGPKSDEKSVSKSSSFNSSSSK